MSGAQTTIFFFFYFSVERFRVSHMYNRTHDERSARCAMLMMQFVCAKTGTWHAIICSNLMAFIHALNSLSCHCIELTHAWIGRTHATHSHVDHRNQYQSHPSKFHRLSYTFTHTSSIDEQFILRKPCQSLIWFYYLKKIFLPKSTAVWKIEMNEIRFNNHLI